jgi:hypothetical protein
MNENRNAEPDIGSRAEQRCTQNRYYSISRDEMYMALNKLGNQQESEYLGRSN